MSTVIVRGLGEISIPNAKAMELRDKWEKNLLKGTKISAGNASFSGDDIRSFKIGDEGVSDEQHEFDMGNPIEKKKVDEFDTEYSEWKTKNSKKYNGEWLQYHFLEEKGAIRMGIVRPLDVTINVKKYEELQKLFASRSSLLYFKAKSSDSDFDRKCQVALSEMKKAVLSKLSSRYVSTKPNDTDTAKSSGIKQPESTSDDKKVIVISTPTKIYPEIPVIDAIKTIKPIEGTPDEIASLAKKFDEQFTGEGESEQTEIPF